ncbi:flagella biosynthesis regulatory protein FliZ [Escherichia coli]
MMVQHLKRRPLSRYLKDFKHSQTHCAHCRKLLDRITLVRDGKIVNKSRFPAWTRCLMKGLANGTKSWAALCRFCGDLHCKTQSDFFDIIGFKQFLFEQTEMSPGTVREYVVRLRRLGIIIYTSKIFPSISCRTVSLMKSSPRGCPPPAPTITASRYGSINTISVKRVPDLCRNPPACLLLIYIK